MRRLEATATCWLDGEAVRAGQSGVALTDPALHSGLGVFETLALTGDGVVELERHLERLERGASALGVPLPAFADLRRWLAAALEGLGSAAGWVKIVVTGGGRCLLYGGPAADAEGGVAGAVLLPWRRSLADPLGGLKTLNYAANAVGLDRARQRGADEGLWLNARGHLAEGCTSNLFLVDNRRLFTPGPGDGILPGLVRRRVLEVAREMGLSIHEGKLRLRRLETAREAFLTSSVRGIRPLVRFEGRSLGSGEPGGLTIRLAAEVQRLRRATAIDSMRLRATAEQEDRP